MRYSKKYLYWILLTVVLCAVLAFTCTKIETIPTHFLVSHEFGTHMITVYDADDGNSYVFLPSYADLDHLTVNLPLHHKITIGDMTLTDGMNCGGFELETPYSFQDSTHRKGTLWFYQSANVATMYINTASKSMVHIHEDQDVRENASVALYTADGTLDYQDPYSSIKGRGNTTWNYHKKPYLLKLSAEAGLLDMGVATKWVLLANAADGSNLNNKLVYDLAEQVGMRDTVQGEFVDLYLNGEYNGLYLLSEKVEVGPNRLDIDVENGDFFAEFGETADNRLSYVIKTPVGRYVTIHEPRGFDEERKSEISQLVLQMEQELLSGQDLTQSTLIDLDSWVCKYIIDEISANVDADRASCYFYCSDGKIFAGPVWDYDKGFGDCKQSRNPRSFVANNQRRSGFYTLPYYPELYSNPSFRNRVAELYETKFQPILTQYINGGIAEHAAEISDASNVDRLRWKGKTPDVNFSALLPITWTTVLDYLTERVAFLNSAWINGVDYCTVQFELATGNEYVNYAVERGQVLQAPDIDLETTVWINSQTGEVFDAEVPVEQDIILVVQETSKKPALQHTDPGVATNIYVACLSISALLFFLACFIVIEFRRSKNGRRQSDAQRG